MRAEIIKALAFPREQIRGELELDDCPHSGQFDANDARCQLCGFEPECHWIVSNDEFAALPQRSLEELLEALEFALGYVDAQTLRWGHDVRSCACDACSWLRPARRLLERVYEQQQSAG